jgi:tetratricopeptide (TPR) repeat protein
MQLLLGDIALVQKNFAQAEALVQKGLVFFRQHGDSPNIAEALSTLGEIYRDQGDLVQAVTFYREALLLDKKMGNVRKVGKHLIGLAKVSLVQRRYEEAASLLGIAETFFKPHLDMHAARRSDYQQTKAYLRSRLGEPAFREAWSRGHSMPLEQAFITLITLIAPEQGFALSSPSISLTE